MKTRRIRTPDEANQHKSEYDEDSTPCVGSFVVDVPGAGWLEFGQWQSYTGGARGLCVGASWGAHGYAGGVMDREAIRELIDYLKSFLDDTHEKIVKPTDDEESAHADQ